MAISKRCTKAKQTTLQATKMKMKKISLDNVHIRLLYFSNTTQPNVKNAHKRLQDRFQHQYVYQTGSGYCDFLCALLQLLFFESDNRS